jgi:hypothetical protein
LKDGQKVTDLPIRTLAAADAPTLIGDRIASPQTDFIFELELADDPKDVGQARQGISR